MTEEEKKAVRDKVDAMTQKERAFKLAEIEERLPKKEIHRLEFIVSSCHEILTQLGFEHSAENASKIYEPVTLLANFDSLYDDPETGFKDVFLKDEKR